MNQQKPFRRHLTIDPGIHTGYAIWDGEEIPLQLISCGAIQEREYERQSEILEMLVREHEISTIWIEKPIAIPSAIGIASWRTNALSELAIRAGWIAGILQRAGGEIRWVDSRWTGAYKLHHRDEEPPHPNKHTADAIRMGIWLQERAAREQKKREKKRRREG